MNVETFRDYCLNKPWVSEGLPFDENTLVFKVLGKIFALINLESFTFINLKCDPEKAITLRESNPGIQPGWHMNKQHWNSVYTDGEVSDPLILELVDHSYDLILNSFSKKKQEELKKVFE